MRYWTTKSSIPDSVRPGLWRDWQRFWNRMRRRHSERDRWLEFRSGTPLLVEGVEYRIRYEVGGFRIRLPGDADEVRIRGGCAGNGKPYVYAEELQGALDMLSVRAVMEE